MNKKTKMLLGFGAIAVAAYYFYSKSKTNTKSFVSLDGGCRYTISHNRYGKTMVYEICPNKPPRLAREVKSY